MKPFSRIAAIAVIASTLFGTGYIARANHYPPQPFVEAQTIGLLRSVQSNGVHVVIDEPNRCKENIYGAAMISADRQRQYLLICASNHGDNLDELGDTIRHEAIHVAQHCRARREGYNQVLPLLPKHVEQLLFLAVQRYHMPLGLYSDEDRPAQAEARVGARILNENQIAAIVERECS